MGKNEKELTINLVHCNRTITQAKFTMKLAIIALSITLMVVVEADIFDTNGLENIESIIADIDILEAVAVDLNTMESRLEGLAQYESAFRSVRNKLTDAMDVDGTNELVNDFVHDNQ